MIRKWCSMGLAWCRSVAKCLQGGGSVPSLVRPTRRAIRRSLPRPHDPRRRRNPQRLAGSALLHGDSCPGNDLSQVCQTVPPATPVSADLLTRRQARRGQPTSARNLTPSGNGTHNFLILSSRRSGHHQDPRRPGPPNWQWIGRAVITPPRDHAPTAATTTPVTAAEATETASAARPRPEQR